MREAELLVNLELRAAYKMMIIFLRQCTGRGGERDRQTETD